MSILRRIARKLGFVHQSEMKRYYAAGNVSRLTSDWVSYPTTADYDVRAGLAIVRARARELTQNDPYAKAFVLACRKNIIGATGFQLQVKAKDYVTGSDGKVVGMLDRFANAIIEQAFADWSRKGVCEISGRFSFRKVQALCVTGVKRDGEIFVRMLRGKDFNRYGFALQLIEPDLIDERYNDILPNGNVIRMGIEITPQRKPVAYYVRRYQPNLGWNQVNISSGSYDRIPAPEMIHLFDPDRVDATRDVSQMAPSMLRLKMLAGYEEAAVINARVSACKMGFFRDPTGEAGEYEGEGKDALGNKISTAEPGQMEDIGRLEFQSYEPKYPDSQHEPFVKSNLHGVAAGLGVSYANLSTDLSDTSFASSRTGLIEEREEWKEGQVWLAENLLDPVFASWLEMGLTMGAIGSLPLSKYEKFNVPKWSGRRWPWVDPLKDAQAMQTSVAAGFKSPQQVISEAGGDMEDIYEEIAEAKKLAEEYGITFDYTGKGQQKESPEESPDTEMAPGGKPTGKGNGKDISANA